MKCPNCKDVNLMMTDRQGIEINYCPECRGIWLDRGELYKIIERSTSQSFPSTGGDAYQDRSQSSDTEDHYNKKKKCKSLYASKKNNPMLNYNYRLNLALVHR